VCVWGGVFNIEQGIIVIFYVIPNVGEVTGKFNVHAPCVCVWGGDPDYEAWGVITTEACV